LEPTSLRLSKRSIEPGAMLVLQCWLTLVVPRPTARWRWNCCQKSARAWLSFAMPQSLKVQSLPPPKLRADHLSKKFRLWPKNCRPSQRESSMSQEQFVASAILTNDAGMHARPSVKLTQLAKSFPATIEVATDEGGPWVDAKSPVKLMRFRAPQGSRLWM